MHLVLVRKEGNNESESLVWKVKQGSEGKPRKGRRREEEGGEEVRRGYTRR
jgi:hypothetical protein